MQLPDAATRLSVTPEFQAAVSSAVSQKATTDKSKNSRRVELLGTSPWATSASALTDDGNTFTPEDGTNLRSRLTVA